jgi:hypothetical protein
VGENDRLTIRPAAGRDIVSGQDVDIHATQHKPVTPRPGRPSAGAAGRALRGSGKGPVSLDFAHISAGQRRDVHEYLLHRSDLQLLRYVRGG